MRRTVQSAQGSFGWQAVSIKVPPHPGAVSDALSARMSRAARRDTAPELALRRELHRRGRRYRVIVRVPGRNRRTMDIAFTRVRLAVFVDGCFWHGCPKHGTMPSHNNAWWVTKLAANQGRDRDTDEHLSNVGWTVLRIWEHVPAGEAADLVEAELDRMADERALAKERTQPAARRISSTHSG